VIIYQYTTTANSKCYIGQHVTDNLVRYFKTDLGRAAKGDTRKPAIYNAMRAYPGTWSARILVRIPDDKERLNRLEQFFIRWFESNDKRKGYNIAAGGGGSFGYTKIISEETRQKMAAASRGRKHSAETRAKMSASGKGRIFSKAHRSRISASRIGKKLAPFTPEHCEKIRQANIGKKLPPEVVGKMRASMLALRQESPAVFKKSKGSGQYKGVAQRGSRWRARIRFKGKDINLGQFGTEAEAAKAYDAAARQYLGKFALFNFPEVGELGALKGAV
jgi:group I intron endonuclease